MPKKLNRETICKTNLFYLKAGLIGPKLLKAGPIDPKLNRKYNATKQAKLEAQYSPNKTKHGPNEHKRKQLVVLPSAQQPT